MCVWVHMCVIDLLYSKKRANLLFPPFLKKQEKHRLNLIIYFCDKTLINTNFREEWDFFFFCLYILTTVHNQQNAGQELNVRI